MQRFGARELVEAHSEVAFCMRNLQHPDCAVAVAGDMYDSLSESRRAVALLELLLRAEGSRFVLHLAQSGLTRRHFLARCARHDFVDPHTCASNTEGLFDALAAGQLGIARDIAALSPKTFRPNEEYEEDFWYAHFLHEYILLGGTASERILVELERALDGASSARLDLCRSLLARDAAAFAQAFDDLLGEHDEVVAHLRLGRALEEVAVAAGTYVFVEGLALLWLAAQAGIATKPDYRYCPPLARAIPTSTAPTDELPPI